MCSIEAGRQRRAAIWAVVLTAVAAQTQAQAVLEDGTTRGLLADAILEAQSEGGPHAKPLIELFTTLALDYRESGNDGRAIAAIDEALTVIRANYGLRSLEQLPLLRQRILAEESRRNFKGAWDLEQDMLDLARAHPEDWRSAEVFREIGDKRMDLLGRYLAGEYPPQLILGCYYTRLYRLPEQPDRNCTGGSRSAAARAILQEAQRRYADAIQVLTRSAASPGDELRGLELALIKSSYEYGVYRTGRDSIARLMVYEGSESQSLLSRAAAEVQLADWDLVFEEGPRAVQAYERVYGSLERAGVPQTAVDELFSPEFPVALPSFLPNPLQSDEPQSTGHIDVAFDITRFGASRRIEILDTTSNASAATRQRLTELIAASRFRPQATHGEFARASRVVVRYFVKE